jgi:ribonuclease E
MVRKMLINASHPEECRVAVVCDGVLEELDVQVKAREATLGNIYKGVTSRIEPSLQAVFVDYGSPRNGFLSINDVHPSYFPESFEGTRRRPRIQDVFKKDDHVLVQVNKEERDTKGASLTTNISLAGRYLVLMPGTDLYGVSRKIEDEKERQKLKEIVKQFKLPENMGFIIRTAGMGRTKAELSRDLDYLLKLWQSIEKNVSEQQAPALLYKEHDIVIRAIREHFSPDISEILVDDKEVHKKVRDFFHQVMPRYENLVRLYLEKRPLFNKYQLEEQVEQVYRRKIRLKSGGHILIEPTEAMVTVDVNSGSATKEKGIEDTAFRVNMEAVPEIARQLRLRDLGGIIVIDFIDMSQKHHKQDVEKEMKAVLRDDRAKTKMLRISGLGLLELTRQRLKSVLGTGEYLECPLCDGQGKIRSPETSALSVYRRIKSLLIRSDVSEVRATVPAKVAEYLLNNMRAQLVEIERQHNSRISILVKQTLPDKDILVEAVKEEALEQPTSEALLTPAPALEVVEAVEEESLAEAEARKTKKPSRRRRRPRKKAPSGAEEQVISVEEEEEPRLEAAPSEEALEVETVAAQRSPEMAEEARPEEELSGLEGPAEPQANEIPVERAAPEAPEAARTQVATSEESTAEEDAKKEAKPRRKSWLQDFLPFS